MTVSVVVAIAGAVCVVLICLTMCLLVLIGTSKAQMNDTAHHNASGGFETYVPGLNPNPKPLDLRTHNDMKRTRPC